METHVSGFGCISLFVNKVLSHVLYILTIARNLLSIGKLTGQGHSLLFDSKKCCVINNHKKVVLLTGVCDPISKLYKLSIATTHFAKHSTQCHLVEPSTIGEMGYSTY